MINNSRSTQTPNIWTRLLWVVVFGAIVWFATACTEQQRVKRFGGTMNLTLKPNEKLIHITWKEQSLWMLTRPMTASDTVQTYTFRQDSKFGIVEGKIVIKEVRQ